MISWQSDATVRSLDTFAREQALTSVLDTLLGEYAMAPIRNAPDDLNTASTVGSALKSDRVVLLLRIIFVEVAVEALLELAPNTMPLLTVRVLGDRLLRPNLDIMGKREPIVAAERRK